MNLLVVSWLRVGNLYLPIVSEGAPVMVHFADKKLKDTNDNQDPKMAETTARGQAFTEPPTQSLPGDGKRGNIGSSIYCRGSGPTADRSSRIGKDDDGGSPAPAVAVAKVSSNAVRDLVVESGGDNPGNPGLRNFENSDRSTTTVPEEPQKPPAKA